MKSNDKRNEIESIKKRLADELNHRRKIGNQISKLENELVKILCPKGKEICEPAYCTFRITDTCPYIKTSREVREEN